MIIKKSVLKEISESMSRKDPECGGVLGAGADGIIDHFYFDSTGRSAPNFYSPDVEAINKVLSEEWIVKGIFMVGIVHSHFPSNPYPSCGDVSYGINILKALDTVERFYLPIAVADGMKIHLNGYVVEKDVEHGYVCRAIQCQFID